MSDIKVLVTFALFISLGFILVSCSDAADTTAVNSNNSNNTVQPPKTPPSNDNIDELSLVIKLPFDVTETAWREVSGQPDGSQKMTAVVRFSSTDTNKLVTELARLGEPALVSIEAEDWFPTELVTKNEMTGDEGLSGKAYQPTLFLQPPYNAGRVIHIDETDFFVIELSVK